MTPVNACIRERVIAIRNEVQQHIADLRGTMAKLDELAELLRIMEASPRPRSDDAHSGTPPDFTGVPGVPHVVGDSPWPSVTPRPGAFSPEVGFNDGEPDYDPYGR